MKIIICGAGQVGSGIARQLASEGNDITVIDNSPEQIQKVNDSLDVSAFTGFPSHPTALVEAGIADAEMIIAVTTSDETNMIICQVAHSLFSVPIKIARIRHKNYLQPIWKDLYRHDHLPIDHIISPEREVATAIVNRLHVPGAMDSIPFVDGHIKAIEIRCLATCPLLDVPLLEIYASNAEINMMVIAILRDGEIVIPENEEILKAGDELFFVADVEHIQQAMSLFGYEEKEARRVLIVGGGNIGFFIAEALEKEGSGINAKLIEVDKNRAEHIATKLPDTTVINGSALDQDILAEANIGSTETVIGVTNDDEVNILSSLLAKRHGCQKAFTLINKGSSYSPLISSLGIDVTINPREMTVSSILQHTRRGKVLAAHSIFGGAAEIIETEVVQHSSIIGKTIPELDLPSDVIMGAIFRKNKTIIPNSNTVIMENDRVIILAEVYQINKVDKIFSARLDYF